ncbi:hypothetical protein BC941DRAFT_390376 [Chlamydoabsidia padenii]|nr:hypothetical protein BC941DRAFT_390376 [Chlamydoabsidia padenii]
MNFLLFFGRIDPAISKKANSNPAPSTSRIWESPLFFFFSLPHLTKMSSDPRRPDKVVPFHMLTGKEDDASDWNSSIAMYTAMGGIFLHNKFKALPWISSYFGLSSFLNGRKSQKSGDSFGGNGAMIAAVSMLTYYVNVYVSHRRALNAYTAGTDDEGIGA